MALDLKRMIAIAGTARSGKTVFLTSLINHLYEHRQATKAFRVGKDGDVQIKDVGQKPIMNSVGQKFNFAAYRDSLVHHQRWPEKTRDTSHFIVNFKRTDWRLRRSQLQLFDLPGERIADTGIARFSDYAEWSNLVLENITNSTSYKRMAGEYLTLLDDEIIDEAELVDMYKLALARFFINFKAMITPSTFLLDQHGSTPKSRSQEEFLKEYAQRHAGLKPQNGRSRQFVPLPEGARAKNEVLAKKFAEHYSMYRNEVALPVFNHLKSCKRLIVLIDIPSLLNGGVGMYNDNRQILEDLFEVLKPESWMKRMFTSFKKLDRVAFVATKSDIVHPEDLNDGRLLNLMREMTDRFAHSLDGPQFEWFTCSAIVSARPADGDHQMRGFLNRGSDSDEKIFSVSELPERWPDDWTPGDFSFPSTKPRVPRNKAIPPDHENLDKVFTFISED